MKFLKKKKIGNKSKSNPLVIIHKINTLLIILIKENGMKALKQCTEKNKCKKETLIKQITRENHESL